ncbi:MAG: FRG domain-containing protein [Hydrogenovibrio sp.]|uniref:FRG domain-containing protein n=1 Tax=Hydrogenovibrio sp. TaxID=2065821 RepID=UPI0028708813|nr:FRG domain-containing protein [Hydrogenovibrio sp.]MDR9498512.1 FRG domain-containing protein [Hydrogenovibrio sp.]MDR9499258.1 FRG domain-containing protein [Hydrogenovibrio sp.]
MKTFKSLNALRTYLQISPINTGERFTHLGIVYTTDEGLHAMTSADNSCVHLRAGVEWALVEYRGQVRDYGSCFSGLDRCKTDADLFDALLRNVVFEAGLQSHPALVRMQRVTFFDKPFCIDKKGVAQHYGLATDYVDITPNFDVASFFATQHWNNKAQRYEPMKACLKKGVMFKMMPAIAILPQGDEPPAYMPIGWQPFERPEQQRANAYRLAVGEDFAKVAAKFRFAHNWEVSKQIYEQFEGGDVLFPHDPLGEFAEHVKALSQFTRAQISAASEKTARFTGKIPDKASVQSWLSQKGCSEVDEREQTSFNWHFDEQVFETKLAEMGKRIRFRRVSEHYQS